MEGKTKLFIAFVVVFVVIAIIYVFNNKSTDETTVIIQQPGNPTPNPTPDPSPTPTPEPTGPVVVPTITKGIAGDLCLNNSMCEEGYLCLGNMCLPRSDVDTIANLRYNMRFKNKDTGKYLCLNNAANPPAITESDGTGNMCTWRTRVQDGKLQIIRNLNNYSIGPKLDAWNTHSADSWPADTKWNYLEDAKVLKNNYYSTDYPPGVQSNIDGVTGGCLADDQSVVKTGSSKCTSTVAKNKWIPEYVRSINCLYNRDCPSGKCVGNVCLAQDGAWCNLASDCSSNICQSFKCGVPPAPVPPPAPPPPPTIIKEKSIISLKNNIYDIYLKYCGSPQSPDCGGYRAKVLPKEATSYWTVERTPVISDRQEVHYGDTVYLTQTINGTKYYLAACGMSSVITGHNVVVTPRTDGVSPIWRFRSKMRASGQISTRDGVFIENMYDGTLRLGGFSGDKTSECGGFTAYVSNNFNDRDETSWIIYLE